MRLEYHGVISSGGNCWSVLQQATKQKRKKRFFRFSPQIRSNCWKIQFERFYSAGGKKGDGEKSYLLTRGTYVNSFMEMRSRTVNECLHQFFILTRRPLSPLFYFRKEFPFRIQFSTQMFLSFLYKLK
jgi:hypothetical protein